MLSKREVLTVHVAPEQRLHRRNVLGILVPDVDLNAVQRLQNFVAFICSAWASVLRLNRWLIGQIGIGNANKTAEPDAAEPDRFQGFNVAGTSFAPRDVSFVMEKLEQNLANATSWPPRVWASDDKKHTAPEPAVRGLSRNADDVYSSGLS
ncbi:hypothetical protein J7T55_005385 [Diaporthe amygdali]|uniref:uncharacterized protein n=1 Tax=Phomopsis amygdali TaxID=1214568 RepID=UPI0022FEE95F|nr:uncharacterized protein J7T55_005385 [Diaporthe amygdali]KAJ0108408.1 hypothetical protein J7T55_005385 [Diaporthe amygdali]